jgi:hypothetical protein
MLEILHKTLLWIHIPFGIISLILFWIPVGVKKGSKIHRKVGWNYFIAMWIVLATAFLMCILNTLMGNYIIAAFLGYLSIITAYPLWYSYEILNQQKEWSSKYIIMRKGFLAIMFLSSIGMCLLGGLKFHFSGMGAVMGFFGILGIPAGRDFLMTNRRAMNKETKLKMHIKGTIISGIAAYTAFFAFGGSRILIQMLELNHQWMILAWTLPTILGLFYARYMRKKYTVAG